MSKSESKLAVVTITESPEEGHQNVPGIPTKTMELDTSIANAIKQVISTEPSTPPSHETEDRVSIPVADLPPGIHTAITTKNLLAELDSPIISPVPPGTSKPAIIPPPLNPSDRLAIDIDGLAPETTYPLKNEDSSEVAPDLTVDEAMLSDDDTFEVTFDNLLSGETDLTGLMYMTEISTEDKATLPPPASHDVGFDTRKTSDFTEIAQHLFTFMENQTILEHQEYITAMEAYEANKHGGTPISEPKLDEYIRKYAARVEREKHKV